MYRISGLDPSLIGLNTDAQNAYILESLNEKDATFVDVIHTDSGFYGTTTKAGHCQFHPNFGHRYQPGCSVANVYNPALAQHGILLIFKFVIIGVRGERFLYSHKIEKKIYV